MLRRKGNYHLKAWFFSFRMVILLSYVNAMLCSISRTSGVTTKPSHDGWWGTEPQLVTRRDCWYVMNIYSLFCMQYAICISLCTGTYSMFLYMLLLFDLRRWKSWKGKMTAYPILTFVQSFVKFQNMDPEIQMKDDGLQHIFYICYFCLTSEVKVMKT